MLSNDNAFLNTYSSAPNGTTKVNPFDQRTMFARFKIATNNSKGINYNNKDYQPLMSIMVSLHNVKFHFIILHREY